MARTGAGVQARPTKNPRVAYPSRETPRRKIQRARVSRCNTGKWRPAPQRLKRSHENLDGSYKLAIHELVVSRQNCAARQRCSKSFRAKLRRCGHGAEEFRVGFGLGEAAQQ